MKPPVTSQVQAGIPGVPTRRRWRYGAAAFVLACCLAAVWYWNANRGASESVAIRAHLAADRHEQARAAAQRWLDANPGSAEARYLLGEALVELGALQDALAEFEKARALGHPEAPLERIVGIILARSGRAAQAEPMLMRDLDRNPKPDAQRDEALARVFIETFRFGPAWEAIERWLAAAPDDPTPYLVRTEVSRQTGAAADKIAEDYQAALTRDSSLSAARLGLADALRGQGRYPQALIEYETLLAKQPDDAKALAGAGLAAMADGQQERAIEFLDRALRSDPRHPDALAARATIALRQRQFTAALPLLDQAIAVAPNNPEVHYLRSLALDGLGRPDDSRQARAETDRLRRDAADLNALRDRVLRAPRDPALQAELAIWLLRHHQPDEGLIWAERAMAAPGGHKDLAAALAEHYQTAGNVARANYYRALAGAPPER